MAKINSLIDNTSEVIYPQTKAAAVIMEDSSTVENAINQRPKLVLSSQEPASTIDDNTLYGVYGDVGQITTQEISDSAVTTAKIASSAVTTVKIADGAVTTAKINNGAVTSDKIDWTTIEITSNNIQNSAITSGKLSTSAVTTTKLANNSVTTAKINNGAVTSSKIDWTTLGVCSLSSNAGVVTTTANFPIPFNQTAFKRGNFSITGSGTTIVVGSGISAVKVSANIFYERNSLNYGWAEIQKNGTAVTPRFIADCSGGYGSAVCSDFYFNVANGDKITIVDVDGNSRVRMQASWITVVAVA